MAHELTETWEVETDNGSKWEVRPSVGKNKGKLLKTFDTKKEANDWSKKRSADYKPNTKARRKLYKKDPKKWLQLYGGWDVGMNKTAKE